MDEMEIYAQRLLADAEKRSRTLGISNTSKIPLTESNVEKQQQQQQQSFKQKTESPKRSKPTVSTTFSRTGKTSSPNNRVVQRNSDQHIAIDSKENVDLALEINITTGPNVQVQVEVEEQEIDSQGNILSRTPSKTRQITANSEDKATSAMIRDSSKNQLQRLGALYSNTENLSSPIHRTESRFDEEQVNASARPTPFRKARFAKLDALANSINSWEDEATSSDNKETSVKKQTNGTLKSNEPKIVGVCPRKVESPKKAVTKPNVKAAQPGETAKSKHLQWDKNVMDALELQGFKRRDTMTPRIEYDFHNGVKKEPNTEVLKQKEVTKPATTTTSVAAAKAKFSNKPVEATNINKKTEVSKGIVSGRAAIFENSSRTQGGSARSQKDPAEMSLKERLALFEKNKGTALIPKAALGMAPSSKQIMADKKPENSARSPANHSSNATAVLTPAAATPTTAKAPTTPPTSASKINAYNKSVKADSNASGSGIRQTVAALLSNTTTISESKISSDIRKAREEEMNVLLNRFNKPHSTNSNAADQSGKIQPTAPISTPSPPPPPPMPTNTLGQPKHSQHDTVKSVPKSNHKRRSDEKLEVSPQVRDALEDVKRVKINPPKNGRLYPVLSDIESTRTESEKDYYTTDENNDELMYRYGYNPSEYSSQEEEDEDSYMDSEEVESNISNNYDKGYSNERRNSGKVKRVHYLDSSTTSSGNDLNEMDDYLDEALEDDDDDYPHHDKGHKVPQKGSSISSNSFCFEKKPINYRRHQTIHEDEPMETNSTNYRSPIKSELKVEPSDDNMVTLTHTVSFYRRQQSQSANSTPVRKVVHKSAEIEQSTSDEETNDNRNNDKYLKSQKDAVDAKIKSLLDNVAIQQQQISQASNALNTCASTFEFSGSTESVVAEWKLLVATHSRQAALNEVTRLKIERCLRAPDAPKECGRLSVKEITVPLKQDYITKLSTDKISGHHLVCLLKYNEHVIATKTIPTLPGLLSVKFPDTLQIDNVYADFKATLEIYGMTAQREVLPHDIKYHIKNKKGVIKTPKGKKPESRLIMPPVQSPAGPNAVRTPGFAHYGFVIFSLREIQRTNWTLNQVSEVSPMTGNVYMKVNCALNVTIDYKGFLTMFEDISGFGAWHRRWCRLHGHVLSYWKYPDDEKKPPIGSLDLSACDQQKITTAPRDVCARLNTLLLELKRPSQEDDRDTLILVRKGDHTIVRHLLSADTKEERNEWCAHFNKALALMRAWGSQR